MKKLLILSGKGGTGKTTTAAAFMRFSEARALADCDVDAPNLHLVAGVTSAPETSDFIGSEKAVVDASRCIGCGKCAEHCRFDAMTRTEDGTYASNPVACEGCGVCAYVCPAQAVTLEPDVAGKQMLYRDSGRVFSTARLRMGRGNSGKLVSAVKSALFAAAPTDAELAVIDGSPGIGCPVIASVSGVDLVLAVAEPSVSGLSDLSRLEHTADMLGSRLAVCINKWDVAPEAAAAIETFCTEHGLPFAGRIPYDKAAFAAINAGHSLADIDCPARTALLDVYHQVRTLLQL